MEDERLQREASEHAARWKGPGSVPGRRRVEAPPRVRGEDAGKAAQSEDRDPGGA